MPKCFKFILLSMLLLCAAPLPAALAQELAIAAVVNDDVISTLDLQARIKLIMATSGGQIRPDQMEQARQQILQGMIDDTLKMQEADRFSILVTPDDVSAAMRALEKQQGKPEGSLRQFIDSSGLSYDSFADQLSSQVAWRKLLARRVQRDIIITEDEVKRAQQRLARGNAIAEVRIASILLPPQPNYTDEALVGVGLDIRSQLAQGAEASQLLAAYDTRLKMEFAPVRWLPESRLAPDLLEAISGLKDGEIATPIATPLGIQIVRLLERRTLRSVPEQNAEVAIKQIIMRLDNASKDAEIDGKMEIARQIARYPGSCMEAGIAGLAEFSGLNIDVNYYRTTMASMSPEVRSMVEPLPVTGITQPFASNDGIHLLMLCERISVPAPMPDADKVRAMLTDEKLALESEKYLRQLTRDAFIDVRL